MVASVVCPARAYSTATVSPALRVSVRLSSCEFEEAGWPSIFVTMSPTSNPAWAFVDLAREARAAFAHQ